MYYYVFIKSQQVKSEMKVQFKSPEKVVKQRSFKRLEQKPGQQVISQRTEKHLPSPKRLMTRQESLKNVKHQRHFVLSKIKKLQKMIYIFLEDPSSSLGAKALNYFILLCIMITTSNNIMLSTKVFENNQEKAEIIRVIDSVIG